MHNLCWNVATNSCNTANGEECDAIYLINSIDYVQSYPQCEISVAIALFDASLGLGEFSETKVVDIGGGLIYFSSIECFHYIQ